jgi:hypothetical protein
VQEERRRGKEEEKIQRKNQEATSHFTYPVFTKGLPCTPVWATLGPGSPLAEGVV